MKRASYPTAATPMLVAWLVIGAVCGGAFSPRQLLAAPGDVAWSAPHNISTSSSASTLDIKKPAGVTTVGWGFNATNTVVDGVTFVTTSMIGTTNSGPFGLSFQSEFAAPPLLNAFSTTSIADASYRNLLNSAGQGGGSLSGDATGTITLSGLTQGIQYQVEVWVNTDLIVNSIDGTNESVKGGNGSAVTLTLNTDDSVGPGQFAVGVFTAAATSEILSFVGSPPSDLPSMVQINAITLATPEPSQLSLICVGIGFLGAIGFLQQRRRNRTVRVG